MSVHVQCWQATICVAFARPLPPRRRHQRPDRLLPFEELRGDTLIANLRQLADAHHRQQLATYEANDETAQLRRIVDDCDAKIARYRAALNAGGDPVLIAG